MTIEEVLAELRSLAQQRQHGADVTAQTLAAAAQLREHGVTGAHLQRAFPPGTPEFDLLKKTRSPSAYAGPGSDPAVARELAQRQAHVLPAGAQVSQPHRGAGGIRSAVELLWDVRDAKAGDPAAHQRLAAVAKGMVGGSFLIPDQTLPGYIEARTAAGPLRALTTTHEVTSRFVRMVLEGDGDLTIEQVPEGAEKPYSSAAVEEFMELIHKSAGTTSLPDELIADSKGMAEDIVVSKFGKAVGKHIDRTLLNGGGVGAPLGLLNHTGINHETITAQGAMAVYREIVRAVNRVKLRLYDNVTVVVHPTLSERFDLAVDGEGRFLFPDGLQAKLGTKARIVEDANLPITGTTVPAVIGDMRQVHFLSREALTIESSQAPGFTSDETYYRAVERWSAVVGKAAAFEVLDGIDPDYVEVAA